MEIDRIVVKDKWIESVSDGLRLRCPYCKKIPDIDYIVDGKIWNELIPKKYRYGVVCLRCIDKLASEQGIDITNYIKKIYFIGEYKTLELKLSKIYYWKKFKEKKKINLG